MTEQELIEKQTESEAGSYYLMKVGMFYHAYENGAFALARLMGYRVKRKARKGGRMLLVAGFPADGIGKVSARMEEKGIVLRQMSGDGNLYLFLGADGTPDETLVDDSSPLSITGRQKDKTTDTLQQLSKEILTFNLGSSTPLEAMNLINRLQRMLSGKHE